MATYIALLGAVNVGGTGKLPMDRLRAMCVEASFTAPRTYIASGNVVVTTDRSEKEIRTALEERLREHAGKSVGVIVRSETEIADVLLRNPFSDRPGNRVMALFSDAGSFSSSIPMAKPTLAFGCQPW